MVSPSAGRAALAVFVVVSGFCVSPGRAQAPVLVESFAQTPIPLSSDPSFGALLPGGGCIFGARTSATGFEPWVTDATGTTTLLKDIFPGSSSSIPIEFTRVGNLVYFKADDGVNGLELWVTDGTAAGTQLVKDLLPGGAGSDPEFLTEVNGELFFTAVDAAGDREIYKSDGTVAGTALVADVRPGAASSKPTRLTAGGNLLFFFADDGVHGFELFASNGSAAGTQRLSDHFAGAVDGVIRQVRPAFFQGKLYYSGRSAGTGREIFSSDGTVAGTGLLVDLNPGGGDTDPNELTVCNGNLFFTGESNATGAELFKTDGTAAGTGLVADIFPGFFSSFPAELRCCGTTLFFTAFGQGVGTELFKSDGTAAGTAVVRDITPGSASTSIDSLICCGNQLFFRAATTASGLELWVSDGSAAGTQLVQDSNPGPAGSQPSTFFCCNGTLLYRNDQGDGTELWASDGTDAGTGQRADIDPGFGSASSNVDEITAAGPKQFFGVATADNIGRELIYFDGVNVQIFDVNPGAAGSDPSDLVFSGDRLYFAATTALHGREMFTMTRDGTPPVLVEDFAPGTASSNPRGMVDIDGDGIAFSIENSVVGRELGKLRHADLLVDGNVIQVTDVNPGPSSSDPTQIQTINAEERVVVFAADDGVHGEEPHASNDQNCVLIDDLNPGPGSSLVELFAKGRELNEIIGTFLAAGAQLLSLFELIDPIGLLFDRDDRLSLVGAAVDRLNITRGLGGRKIVGQLKDPGGMGNEPFMLDENDNLTVFDLNPGPGNSNPDDFEIINEIEAIFRAFEAGTGTELRCLDTQTGTITTFDVLPGPEGSSPSDLEVVQDTVFFSAGGNLTTDRDVYGLTNGNVTKLADMDPSSTSPEITPVGGKVLVSGSGRNEGRELFEIANPGPTTHEFGKHDPEANLKVVGWSPGNAAKARGDFGLNVGNIVLAVDLFQLLNPIPFGLHEVWIQPNPALIVFFFGESTFDHILGVLPTLPNPALVGLEFVFQAAIFVNQSGSSQVLVTNAVLARL